MGHLLSRSILFFLGGCLRPEWPQGSEVCNIGLESALGYALGNAHKLRKSVTPTILMLDKKF